MKTTPYRQWRLEDLVLAKVKGFLAWLTKVNHLFFIPICFPLFDVCDVCFCCYLHLPHKIMYFLCPILIPNCRPRVCVNVYIFSYGFISTTSIAMDIDNIFRLPNMCQYFLLNPIIPKPCCCMGIIWNHAREIKPYIRYQCLNPSDGCKFVFFVCLNPSDGCKFLFFKVEIAFCLAPRGLELAQICQAHRRPIFTNTIALKNMNQ